MSIEQDAIGKIQSFIRKLITIKIDENIIRNLEHKSVFELNRLIIYRMINEGLGIDRIAAIDRRAIGDHIDGLRDRTQRQSFGGIRVVND